VTCAPSRFRRRSIADAGSFCPPPSWEPACLEPDELELWRERDRGIPPCHSCPLAFAAEQRAIGRCNGQPSGADDEDEEDQVNVGDIGVGGQVTQERQIELIAPCPSCLHREVCGLKEKLESAGEADVTMARLPDELQIVLQARVDCSFYARDKSVGKRAAAADGTPAPKRAGPNWSPEQRAAAAARLAERRARAAAESASA
jgi:hypothetical protein